MSRKVIRVQSTSEGWEPPRGTLTRKLEVRVTPELIANATQRDSSHCMIADAIKEQIPGVSRVSVDLQSIRFTMREQGVRYVYFTPASGQVALLKFDQGEVIKPFTLKAAAPAQVTAARTSKMVRGEDGEMVEKRTAPSKRRSAAAPRGPGCVPVVVGGNTPPVGALADPPARVSASRPEEPGKGAKAVVYRGKRRSFGLRQLRA